MDKKIEIWSTYPPPYGGVSIHSMRLFNILRNKHNLIFKNFNGSIDLPNMGIFIVKSQLKEILLYFFKRNIIIHLHSNRVLVWFLLLFYHKSNKIILTIHNQNLKKNLSWYKRTITVLFFKRVKFIFLNNEEFSKYLITKFKVDKNKLVVIPAFIPPLKEESEELPKEIENFFSKFDKTISSFAWKLYKVNNNDVYGIDHIIEAFALLKKQFNSVGLLIIIPIIEDTNHFKKILDTIERLNLSGSVLIYTNSIRNGFDIWKNSDIFLRSTITDIEGISIKEALFFNTNVIATDVVERPDGVDLYSYGNIKELSKLMLLNLQKNKIEKDVNNILNGIDKIDKVYNTLIN